jgi:flagellar hook-basal body complex protein FliE
MTIPANGISQAVSAYARAARPEGPGLESRDRPGDGGEFADLVKNALKEAKRIGEKSEQMSIQGIQDKADLNQVITAVAEAELTLQTVVAIRDKVVDAYKEILRMPI